LRLARRGTLDRVPDLREAAAVCEGCSDADANVMPHRYPLTSIIPAQVNLRSAKQGGEKVAVQAMVPMRGA
jgi:hypothetical protein